MMFVNIDKGTTDPSVEFSLAKVTFLGHINFKISTESQILRSTDCPHDMLSAASKFRVLLAIWFGFFDNGLWRELMVSLVIFSESISSGQSVLLKIWCSVEILKMIWPKKVTLAKLKSTLGSVVPLAMFKISFLPSTSLHTAARHKGRQSGAKKSHWH